MKRPQAVVFEASAVGLALLLSAFLSASAQAAYRPDSADIVWSGTQTWTSSATFQNSEFSVGATTLVVTGGKVGIGTTAPAFDLEVNGQVAAPGMWVRISDTTLGVAAGTIPISNIPAQFTFLKIIFQLAGTNTVRNNVAVQFNGDTAADYGYVLRNVWTNGSAGVATASLGLIAELEAATTPINWTVGQVLINNVAGLLKDATATSASHNPNVTASLVMAQVTWFNAVSSITSITLFPNAGNFKAGSRVIVYGLF